MKLSRENKFAGLVGRIKRLISKFDIKTCFGKIKTYLTIPLYELYADEFDGENLSFLGDEEVMEEEFGAKIYHLEANSIAEFTLVKQIIAAGYIAIISLGKLTESDREQFLRQMKLDLFKEGIPTYPVNDECVIVADAGVEVVDFEKKVEAETDQSGRSKIINLFEKRPKKY